MTFFETGKWSIDSTFMAAISGLIMITPSAGFIGADNLRFGIFGVLLCRQALQLKSTKLAHCRSLVDNGDTFATHCVGGIAATIFTDLFAQKVVAAYGVLDILGGVFFGNIR